MKLKKNLAISENGLVFNPQTGDSFSLNPIGSEILNMIREGKGHQEIRQGIVKKYDVDDPVFEMDFEDFLNQLKHLGFFE